MRLLYFTHKSGGEYVVFVEDNDDTPEEDYAAPDYKFEGEADLGDDPLFDLLDIGASYKAR